MAYVESEAHNSSTCLAGLMAKAGIYPVHLSKWHIADSLSSIESRVKAACGPQLAHVQRLRDTWHKPFHIPDEWKPQPLVHDVQDIPDPIDNLAAWELAPWLEIISSDVMYMSHDDVVRRHMDPTSFQPDFLLSGLRRHGRWEKVDTKDSFYCDPKVSIVAFKNAVTYVGDEESAASIVPDMFTTTPGCWLRCNPGSDFPSVLAGEYSCMPIDFVLLLHPIGPSTYLGVERDHFLRISVLHPALVVGIKGPAQWLTSKTPSDRSPRLEDVQYELGRSIHPSLSSHLLNWYLRCEQTEDDSESLESAFRHPPDYLILFGISYDAECIRLIAHIPFVDSASEGSPQWSYLSCIVDELPFGPMPQTTPDLKAWCVERFQVAFALLAMRKHAFRLACLWDDILWPTSIRQSEHIHETEYLGPTPTPSEIDGSEWFTVYIPEEDDEEDDEEPAPSEDAEELRLEMEEIEEMAKASRPIVERWVTDVQVDEAIGDEVDTPEASG
ncbi:hypothetical protein SCP_0603750 [Sparassis crispa]|uniref:Uncharacterized protein n=1 Tax=Sparassis crispa TaxID=139825 RepID=A0A401GQ98_9APHY|nr:hypothetical protein SCP_0603750 [Sparassis crispa]GBE84396.1 hypothetical protein SCP_0603750 [Sparassis crispa]